MLLLLFASSLPKLLRILAPSQLDKAHNKRELLPASLWSRTQSLGNVPLADARIISISMSIFIAIVVIQKYFFHRMVLRGSKKSAVRLTVASR
jgi:hypothetical protein